MRLFSMRLLRLRVMLATLATIVLFVAGCGGEDTPSQTATIELEAPRTPTAAQCGLDNSDSQAGKESPPKPGTYDYATTGTRSVIGESEPPTELPSATQLVVTTALEQGAQACFISQHRLEDNLGETGVFVISGEDTFVRSAEFQVGADISEVIPDPPILALSGSELEWSGTFDGATRGRYAASIAGRKTFRIGGERVEAVGVETRTSYAGEIEGVERATRWLDSKTRLIIAEEVLQERTFGLDRLRLKYKSKLKSLTPR